jgi:NCAIR mutase (PurE)-related protein
MMNPPVNDSSFRDPSSRPSVSLPFATVDLERRDRCGFPEVIFCEGKTSEWVVGVIQQLIAAEQDVLATRLSPEQIQTLTPLFPAGEIDPVGRTFWLPRQPPTLQGKVLIVTAGTTDLPVAREALNTAKALGTETELIVDVGVAGLHRLLRHREKLLTASVIVVVAGMDGALPSVVGGLVDCPVIAVPTSVGYGTAFKGVAPLLTMLNACSANVVVVNIDAGFKAGYVAALIARRSLPSA